MAIIQENFLTYTKVDEGSDITVAAALLTITAIKVRFHTAYLYKNKGVGAIASGYSYDQYVNVTNLAANTIPYVWMSANGIGDAKALRAAGIARLGLIYGLSGTRFLQINQVTGVASSESQNGTFTWALSTNYRNRITRSGQTVTVKVYDEDDSGALKDTVVYTASARALVNHQYLYPFATYDDNDNAGDSTLAIGPLWDNNASIAYLAGAAASQLITDLP